MIPSIEEYNKAKEIVKSYDDEQTRLTKIKLETFKIELIQYINDKGEFSFTVDGIEFRKDFTNLGYDILLFPRVEVYCSEELSDYTEKLAIKHGVEASFPYWMYPK